MDIKVEDYTPRSIIVYGPGTIGIKDELRKLGHWRPLKQRKTPKWAWIIPKKHKMKVLELVKPSQKPKSLSEIDNNLLLDCIDKTSRRHDISVRDLLDVLEEKYPGLKQRALSLGADPLSLLGLPSEILEKVALRLSYDQILHMCRMSPKFSNFCTERFWHKKVLYDYGNLLPDLREIDLEETLKLHNEFNNILLKYLDRLREERGISERAPVHKRIKVGDIFLGKGVKTWKHALEQLIILVEWGKIYGPHRGETPEKKFSDLMKNKLWGLMKKRFVNSYGDTYNIVYPLGSNVMPPRFRDGKLNAEIDISTSNGDHYYVDITTSKAVAYFRPSSVLIIKDFTMRLNQYNPMIFQYQCKTYKLDAVGYTKVWRRYPEAKSYFQSGCDTQRSRVIKRIIPKIDTFVQILKREFLFLGKISLDDLEGGSSFKEATKKLRLDSFKYELIKIYENCVRHVRPRLLYWACIEGSS